MNNEPVILTLEQSADVAEIVNLKNAPHDLGEEWPRTCRTSYDIGYLDALKAAADLMVRRYAHRAAKGSGRP